MNDALREQLWDRLRAQTTLDAPSGCWLWQGYKNPQGHGLLWQRHGGRRRLCRVHRLAFLVWSGGRLTSRDAVCCCPQHAHCINPRHLVVRPAGGTASATAGARNGRAKLTEAEARMLLETYQRQASSPEELAALVGDRVKADTIVRLIQGRIWKHLERAQPPWAA